MLEMMIRKYETVKETLNSRCTSILFLHKFLVKEENTSFINEVRPKPDFHRSGPEWILSSDIPGTFLARILQIPDDPSQFSTQLDCSRIRWMRCMFITSYLVSSGSASRTLR